MTICQRAARAFLAFAIATLVLSWATATYAQQEKSDAEKSSHSFTSTPAWRMPATWLRRRG
jgi:hypothetical protein